MERIFVIAKEPIWGMKRGKNVKSIVSKIKEGDYLWFLTSKKYGGSL